MELCEGQHTDTDLEQRAPEAVTLDEVLAMAEAKTGALLGCACALGALYAGAGEEEVAALDGFGRQAGLAFQLIDDVIGIWGDPRHTGKPAGAGSRRPQEVPAGGGRAHLRHPGGGRTRPAGTASRTGREAAEAGEIARIALAVERAGGRDWAQAEAADRMARAMQELARAVPDPEAAGGLLALAEFVTRRTS